MLENSYSDLLVVGCERMVGRGDMERGTRCVTSTELLPRFSSSTPDTASRARDSSFRRCGERCGDESLLNETASGMAASIVSPSTVLFLGVAWLLRLMGCLPLESSVHVGGGQACGRYSLWATGAGSVDRWRVSSCGVGIRSAGAEMVT